jgi:hypothetical protein
LVALLPWQRCGLSWRQRSCSADHASVLRVAASAQGGFRPGAAGPSDHPWTLARDPIFWEAARCISFGTCRAYRRAGFCREQTSCQTTKCRLESRCRVGSDKNCSSGALGERRRRRPRSWRADGATAKKAHGLWARARLSNICPAVCNFSHDTSAESTIEALRPRRAYESAANSSTPTRPLESLDPFMVEHKFRDRARDIYVAHQR